MLRAQDMTGDQGGQSPEAYLPTFEVRDAERHNIDMLPHLHGADDVERFFPVLQAPPVADNVEDWEPKDNDDGPNSNGDIGNRVRGRRGLRGSRPPGSMQQ